VFQRSPQRCERVQEWVSLSVDGELSRFERALADRHLARCAACRAFEDDVVGFTDLLRSAALEPPEQPVVTPLRRRRVLPSLHVAAAALAMVAVGLGALSSLSDEERIGRAPAIQIDEGRDQLRARQLRTLEERNAPMRPRPAGEQPV
jgi:predicted anti-sigma-YlaC factor YlaD